LIDGLPLFLERGYVVVATDYLGLGGEGRHPYLVGPVAAANVIDAVLAAQAVEEAGAGSQYAVWGPSQGGHAALFTGSAEQPAGLELVGVAAAAPPTDLKALFEANLGTPFGNVLASFAFDTWPDVYADLELSQVVRTASRPVVRNIASYCFLEEKQTLAVLPGAALLRISFLSEDPVDTEPWSSRLEENSPQPRIAAPLFLAQGEDDPLVLPSVTASFARQLCQSGASALYQPYPGVGHVPIGPAAAADVADWIGERFEGEDPPSSCQ
jgi:acetyl esterase/lipase